MVGQWLWSLSSLWVGLVLRGLIVTELACLLAIVAWAQKVPTYVVVVVAVLLVMLLVLAVSPLAKLSVLPRG